MGFKEITSKDFTSDGKIKNGKKGLIFFSQSWCPFCVKAKPLFKQYANSKGQSGYLIDGENNKDIFGKFGVQGIPDIRKVDSSGKIGQKFQGERSLKSLKDFADGKSGGGKKKIRRHSGINQQTGRLKRGYKYSGKLKSGLSRIVKVKKGGGLKFKQKGPSENKYADCRKQGCSTVAMPYCCPNYTKSPGFCRKHHEGCDKKGIEASERKGTLSADQLKKLRRNMNKRSDKKRMDDALSFLDKILKEDKEEKKKENVLKPKSKKKSFSFRSFRTNNLTPKRSKPIKIPKRKR